MDEPEAVYGMKRLAETELSADNSTGPFGSVCALLCSTRGLQVKFESIKKVSNRRLFGQSNL